MSGKLEQDAVGKHTNAIGKQAAVDTAFVDPRAAGFPQVEITLRWPQLTESLTRENGYQKGHGDHVRWNLLRSTVQLTIDLATKINVAINCT